jgi:osmotically-inducible protein OsmY
MTYEGELYTKVMDKLKFEPGLDTSNITIAIRDKGVVVLGGKVKSYTEKYLAEEAVKKVEAVYGVANELEVDLAPTYRRSDAEIAQSVINALRSNMFVPADRIKVTVEKGHVSLSGEVDYYFQKERAVKAIRDIVGITNITNNIIVKPPVTPTQIKEKILQEFERNARINASNIEGEIDVTEVTLKGKVKNFDEKEEAIRAA